MIILTLEDAIAHAGCISMPAWIIATLAERPGGTRLLELCSVAITAPAGQERGTVAAVLYRGAWIVRCPHCAGAQMAHRTEHRFWCVDCQMQAAGGAWALVAWPDAATVRGIEAAALARPNPMNRNWLPHETVEDLLAENREHGIGEAA